MVVYCVHCIRVYHLTTPVCPSEKIQSIVLKHCKGQVEYQCSQAFSKI